MPDFPVAQLGDLAKPERAAIAIGPFGSRMKADVYVPIGVPVIRGTNISNDRSLKGDWVYVPEDFAATMPACILQSGDLVFPHRGSIGEVALIEQSHVPMIISSSMMKFRPDPRRLDSRFAYYFFKSQPGREEILRFGSQVGTPGIGQPLTSLKQFRIPLPPLEQQEAIASILSVLDDKIELNRRMNETLEAMARAIFKDWFVDFGPTRAKMEGRAPYLAPDLWSLFPDRLDDEGKPGGWPSGRLDDLLVLQRGFDLPSNARSPGSVTVMAASGPNGTHNKAMVKGPGVTTGRSGVLGRVFFVMEDFWPLNTSLWIKEFKLSSPLHAYFLLQELDFAAFNAGSAVPTLNRNHVHSLLMPLAPKALVNAFDNFCRPMMRKIRANEIESETLATTRDFLLPKLMSGEVRVKDAEKHLGEVA